MRRIPFLCLAAAAVVTVTGVQASGHPAKEVVDLIWKHMGGKSVYEKARFVRFTWASEREGSIQTERHHVWDRYTGDYVFEMVESKTGDTLKVLFNVETREGIALRNGEPVADEENGALVERAYGAFINDTYWLLAPTKLEDYGARLTYVGHEGEDEEEGSHLIILYLFFDKDVGLTPGDKYWFYVDHHGQIARWRYRLQGGQEGEWVWSEERDCGMGLTLATRKTSLDGTRAIVFPEVVLTDQMDTAIFRYPPGP